MGKNILVVISTISGNSPQAIRFRKLADCWSKENNVTILTKDNFPPGYQFPASYTIVPVEYSSIGKLLITNVSKHSAVDGTSTGSKSLRSTLRRLWRKTRLKTLIFPDVYILEIRSFKKHLDRLLKRNKFDAVIVSATPYSFLKLVKYVSKKTSINCIYDVSDPFWLNGAGEIHRIYRNRICRRYEEKYLPHCNKVVTYSPAVKRHYQHHFSRELSKIPVEVIDQGVEYFESCPGNTNQANGKFVFTYAGRFYKGMREPFQLYKAIYELGIDDYEFRFYGSDDRKFYPTERSNIVVGGQIAHEGVIAEYGRCDAIVFIDNFYGVQVPGKIIEVLASKKPVLFIYENSNSPTFDYVKDLRSVIKARNDYRDIVASIRQIREDRDKFRFDYDVSQYFWHNLARKYEGLF